MKLLWWLTAIAWTLALAGFIVAAMSAWVEPFLRKNLDGSWMTETTLYALACGAGVITGWISVKIANFFSTPLDKVRVKG